MERENKKLTTFSMPLFAGVAEVELEGRLASTIGGCSSSYWSACNKR